MNSNIKNIIKKYLLPNKIDVFNNNNKCKNELILKTDIIHYKLKHYDLNYIKKMKHYRTYSGKWNLIIKNNYFNTI